MKIKGALISQLSGKLGGIVAATVKGGIQVLRRRPGASAKNTPLQAIVRAAMAALSQRWSQVLTQAQRDAWDTYALNVSRLNNQGDTIHISGFAWYVGNNIPRVNQNGAVGTLALATVDDAPATYDVGNPAAFEPGNWTASATTTGTLSLGFGAGLMPMAGTAGAGNAVLVYASTPFSAGRAEPVGPNNLVMCVDAGATNSFFEAALPTALIPPDTNSQMKVELRLSRADGRLSSPFRTDATVS